MMKADPNTRLKQIYLWLAVVVLIGVIGFVGWTWGHEGQLNSNLWTMMVGALAIVGHSAWLHHHIVRGK
ncbi:hypothetical protein K9861_07550 [Lacticaseibacillus saniviri]|nr:hypothetical protein [Lacticaseibacillus saniviri]